MEIGTKNRRVNNKLPNSINPLELERRYLYYPLS